MLFPGQRDSAFALKDCAQGNTNDAAQQYPDGNDLRKRQAERIQFIICPQKFRGEADQRIADQHQESDIARVPCAPRTKTKIETETGGQNSPARADTLVSPPINGLNASIASEMSIGLS